MKIEKLDCDFCGYNGPYPGALDMHEHRELEIGGVPMNIWSPEYSYAKPKLEDYLPELNLARPSGPTPLLNLAGGIYLKDERANPTGSFKDRGMIALVSDALRSGKRTVAIPSTGNAAISLGHYCKSAGISSLVFIPKDTPMAKQAEIQGNSDIIHDDDLIQSYEHFFVYCRSHQAVYNGFPATNIPYIQGLKSMAYEIFQQLGTVPDWVVVPVGSGGAVVGIHSGFEDIMQLGLADTMPHFATVQISGADPITVGYRLHQLDKVVILDEMANSRAEAIASDTCFNYFKIQRILADSAGIALSVTDDEITATYASSLPRLEFSSRSVYAAMNKLPGLAGEKIVLIGTARERDGN